MSRIAMRSLNCLNVTIKEKPGFCNFYGSAGETTVVIPSGFSINIENNILKVNCNVEQTKKIKAIWGTLNALIKNAISGVQKMFQEKISLNGKGYQLAIENNKIIFKIGFAKEKEVEIPNYIKVTLVNKTNLILEAVDKEKLCTFADKLTKLKKIFRYKNPVTGIIWVGRNRYTPKEITKKKK